MGMIAALGLVLGACGGPPAQQADRQVPRPLTLRGHPGAVVDDEGQSTPDTRWANVVASHRAQNDTLRVPGMDPPLPVRRERHRGIGETGLALGLDVGDGGRTVATIRAIGPGWPATFGCNAVPTWASDIDAWHQALQALQTAAPRGGIVEVLVDPDVGASDVVAFLQAAARPTLATHLVVPGTRRRFSDGEDRALRWLAVHQHPNGSWHENNVAGWCEGHRMQHEAPSDDEADVGCTGLVASAFLAAGYTNRGKHDFSHTVGRALRFLRSVQSDEGRFGEGARDHILACHAMLTVCAMTGSPIFRVYARKGLSQLERAWNEAHDDPIACAAAALCVRTAREVDAGRMARGQEAVFDALSARFVDTLRDEALTFAHSEALKGAAGVLGALLLLTDEVATPHLDEALRRVVHAEGDLHLPSLWLAKAAALQSRYRAMYERLGPLVARYERSHAQAGDPCCGGGSIEKQVAPTAYFVLASAVRPDSYHARWIARPR